MSKQPRMGVDPLNWIKDSRDEQKTSSPDLKRLHQVQKKAKNTSQAGLKNGWRRATVAMKETQLEKIKNLAYWQRTSIKDIFHNLLEEGLKNKNPKPRPKND